jgi:hypothetical protein
MLKTKFSVIRSCFNSISKELMIILTSMVSVNRKVWCKQSYRKMRKGMKHDVGQIKPTVQRIYSTETRLIEKCLIIIMLGIIFPSSLAF